MADSYYSGGDSDTLPPQESLLTGRNPFAKLAYTGDATPGAGAQPSLQDNGVIAQLTRMLQGQQNPTTTGLANAGSVLGKFSEGEAANRMMKGNFTQNYDRLMQDAQTGRNQNEGDALKKLAITSYLMNGGFKGGPTSITLNGQTRTLPSYGSAPLPASAAQMQGAGTLQSMLLDRLKPGGSYTPQPLAGYATPGTAERTASLGGAATTGLGVINDLLHGMGGASNNGDGGSVISDIANKVPWGKIGSGLKSAGGSIIHGLSHVFGG